MSEPEELIIEGAHAATRVARDLWRRYGPAPRDGVALASVRVRLELFVTALFGVDFAIRPMEPPAPGTWLSRLAHSRTRVRADPRLAGNDGRQIFLPPAIGPNSSIGALDLYRLLAVEQAARIVRGSSRTAVDAATHVRDLFLLAEAAAVDRFIAAHVPGLMDTLRQARSDALERRGTRPAVRSAETLTDAAVRALLSADPAAPGPGLPGDTPAASLAWARRTAMQHGAGARYRGIEPVWYWGESVAPARIIAASGSGDAPETAGAPQRRPRVTEMRRTPRPREAREDEDDQNAGTWVIRADDPQESVEDPLGLQRPLDTDEEPDVDGLGDSLSDLPEARMVRTPGRPREILHSGEWEAGRADAPASDRRSAAGIAYPEWDCRIGGYRHPGAIVRELDPPAGDAAWVVAALSRHARLIRRVRTRFERLRPRLVRVARQVDGSDIDMAAYVTSAADRRAGVAADGRLYVTTHPARRELAVALLLDVSASTDAWVSADRRIVDVEKEAMLVVCEALEALGDRYALFAFSGEGADHVSVLPLKGFDERADTRVRRRIAALDSDRYTRLGAPLRHVTAALCREHAAARLLLLLTDGKPNDVDVYEGAYGVEDTRQAVAEARRQGVTVFCLTVDREAPRYATRIFGPGRFAVLHGAGQLPAVVVDVLRQLIRR